MRNLEKIREFCSCNFHYIRSCVASDSIVLIGEVDRHFTSAPAIQCPIEELCQVCVLWGSTAQTAAVRWNFPIHTAALCLLGLSTW